ncbi:sec-independent protein translocase protein TatC [bacterium BMS3Bbin12]|nr:sec-independent protein translocase protein TatC [bacterium BMS3Abin12]GBE47109.1 sec-independent protein translocase protein TatC [bacterium BMS3Bbin12]GBE51364.1 sec-independent protein translocase protein TatC [bacterium BMS3Bbin13]HDJ86160.1 twin-arginine translocase subunit TatC [Chromatiales bacterium]HDO34517.1 twin-arginine translocase subunit TatC [Chromatiales bacterium]
MTERPEKKREAGDEEQPFVSHLIELRGRLLRSIAVVVVIFMGLSAYADTLYSMLAKPLLRQFPKGSSMIAIDVTSPFLAPFHFALVLAIFLAMPYLLYQIWAFIAPGLYRHERRFALPLLVSSTALFYGGMAFAYFVVFPLMFRFFTHAAPRGVKVMTDIKSYLDFVLTMFFAFGIAFETPIATILLVWTGATTPQKLARMRPYVIVACFVIGMLLTPPDVLSQVSLAVPMWLLFELGVAWSRFFVRRRETADAVPAGDTHGDGDGA